jgi:hypothetical protein
MLLDMGVYSNVGLALSLCGGSQSTTSAICRRSLTQCAHSGQSPRTGFMVPGIAAGQPRFTEGRRGRGGESAVVWAPGLMIPETPRLDRGESSFAGELACESRKVAGWTAESCRGTESFRAVTRTTIRGAATLRRAHARTPPDYEPGAGQRGRGRGTGTPCAAGLRLARRMCSLTTVPAWPVRSSTRSQT